MSLLEFPGGIKMNEKKRHSVSTLMMIKIWLSYLYGRKVTLVRSAVKVTQLVDLIFMLFSAVLYLTSEQQKEKQPAEQKEKQPAEHEKSNSSSRRFKGRDRSIIGSSTWQSCAKKFASSSSATTTTNEESNDDDDDDDSKKGATKTTTTTTRISIMPKLRPISWPWNIVVTMHEKKIKKKLILSYYTDYRLYVDIDQSRNQVLGWNHIGDSARW
jgi:hypothetical protein